MKCNNAKENDALLTTGLNLLKSLSFNKISHSDNDLLSHLKGTYNLLIEWNAPSEVCFAGLFHSVFGTEIFEGGAPSYILTDIQNIFGVRTARLSWLFGVITRPSFLQAIKGNGCCINRKTQEEIEATQTELADLSEIFVANAVEQLPRLPPIYMIIEREFLTNFRARISPKACETLDKVLIPGTQ